MDGRRSEARRLVRFGTWLVLLLPLAVAAVVLASSAEGSSWRGPIPQPTSTPIFRPEQDVTPGRSALQRIERLREEAALIGGYRGDGRGGFVGGCASDAGKAQMRAKLEEALAILQRETILGIDPPAAQRAIRAQLSYSLGLPACAGAPAATVGAATTPAPRDVPAPWSNPATWGALSAAAALTAAFGPNVVRRLRGAPGAPVRARVAPGTRYEVPPPPSQSYVIPPTPIAGGESTAGPGITTFLKPYPPVEGLRISGDGRVVRLTWSRPSFDPKVAELVAYRIYRQEPVAWSTGWEEITLGVLPADTTIFDAIHRDQSRFYGVRPVYRTIPEGRILIGPVPM